MRYYKNELPKVNDVVFVRFSEFSENAGIYVDLIEYDNLQGLILLTEISKRTTNPLKVITKHKIYPCVVLNITDKQSIDLSYKKLSEQDKITYETNFGFTQRFNNLVKTLIKLDSDREQEIYENIMWPMFEKHMNKSEFLYNQILQNPSYLFKYNKTLDDEFIKKIEEHLKQRITESNVKISKNFNLKVLSENAITKIKLILTENMTDPSIKITCISSPVYNIIVTSDSMDDAHTIMDKYTNVLLENAHKYRGIITMNDELKIIQDKIYTLHN